MAFNDKQGNSIMSIDKFNYAPITKNDVAGYTHPVMSAIAGLIEIGIAFQLAEGELYADGGRFYSDSSTVGVDLSLNIASLPEKIKAEWFGNDHDPLTGKTVVSTTDTPIELAIAFRALKKDGQYTYFKMYVAKASLGDETMTTKSSDINYQTENLTLKCTAKVIDSSLFEKQLAGSDGAEASTFFNAAV